MYETLARYYDKFMAKVPYGRWAEYVGGFLPGRRGHDVGAGTGRFTLALSALGYEMTGSDPSPEMLAVAAENARAAGADIKFVLLSAEELTSPAPLDFVTACCDVVNYLPRPEKFFSRAYGVLGKGGALAFDVSSEHKLRDVIGNNVFTDEAGDVTYVWENFPARGRVEMRLTFFSPDGNGRYVKSVDEQVQFIHGREKLTSALSAAGFTGIKSYGFGTRRRASNKDERVFYIAYKE